MVLGHSHLTARRFLAQIPAGLCMFSLLLPGFPMSSFLTQIKNMHIRLIGDSKFMYLMGVYEVPKVLVVYR